MSDKKIYPLMPKATAVWLVDNTSLTFKQIADFCGLHEIEIKGIADGDVAGSILGIDPVIAGQIDRSELERCMKDQNAVLKIKSHVSYSSGAKKTKKAAKYTPIARRQDKPDAVYWILKNHPEIRDSEIIKLLGTTKSTLAAIKDRTHWNMANIRPRDPVLLGICSQADLNYLIEKVNLRSGGSNSERIQNTEEEFPEHYKDDD
jgi:hypothetical protein